LKVSDFFEFVRAASALAENAGKKETARIRDNTKSRRQDIWCSSFYVVSAADPSITSLPLPAFPPPNKKKPGAEILIDTSATRLSR
jgi:hypothetical protein